MCEVRSTAYDELLPETTRYSSDLVLNCPVSGVADPLHSLNKSSKPDQANSLKQQTDTPPRKKGVIYAKVAAKLVNSFSIKNALKQMICIFEKLDEGETDQIKSTQ